MTDRSRSALWLVALGGGALALSACATVTRGTHQPFRIVSTPTGASVQLSNGQTCTTPCRLDLPRGAGFQVRVSLAGHATQMLTVASKGSGAGVVGMLANGVVGGVVGAGTDMDSGAMRSLSPNPLVVKLEPVAPPKP
ncbi:MAG: PEGA domain-containing protein [Sphingomonadales bacterium]|nr:PEGA domain-containing protein [Sphingomonadales bacterium]